MRVLSAVGRAEHEFRPSALPSVRGVSVPPLAVSELSAIVKGLPEPLSDFAPYHAVSEKSRVAKNNFEKGRNFAHYIGYAGLSGSQNMMAFMKSLPPGSIWFDSGAGGGLAMHEYFSRATTDYTSYELSAEGVVRPTGPLVGEHNHGLQGISLAFRRPDNMTEAAKQSIADGRFRYVESDIIDFVKKNPNLKVDVMTDFYGPLFYVRMPDVLEAYARLLKPGGRLYFYETSLGREGFAKYLSRSSGFVLRHAEHEGLSYLERTDSPTHFPVPSADEQRSARHVFSYLPDVPAPAKRIGTR